MKRPFEGKYTITQEWGVNPADYARFGLKGHNGVDYATPVGTPILAPHNGKVIEVAYDQYGYGTYVKIENEAEGSILAHLTKHETNPGDYVTEGTKIGESGNTGNSTGPHLHWGYYRMPRDKSNGYSGTTNPWQYLDENQPKPPADPCANIKAELTTAQDAIRDFEKIKIDCQDDKKALNTTISNLNIKLTVANQEIDNREEQVDRIIKTAENTEKSLQKQIEGLKTLVDQSGTGIATYLDQIKTLESQFDSESKAKGKALNLLAASEERVRQLEKQIRDNAAPNFKTMPIKERIKYCIDILFT